MRKRIYLAALCLGAALAMAGCSDGRTNENDDNTTSSVSGQTESGTEADSGETADGEENDAALEELEALPLVDGEFVLEDCIRLGEYKGLELTRTVEAVTDEDVESYVNSLMTPEEVTDEGATVQEGDTVNIAYEGTQDGVAFEGGTSESADLVIGSGRFIDGFEDGLIGMKAGESRDLNLTFPEDYRSEEMQGAEVVFHVTVHTISRPPELTDAWVEENTDGAYGTADEFRQYVRENLETNRQNTAEQTLRQEAWTMIQENSEFLQLPASYVEEGEMEFESGITQEAAYSGMELEEYIENNGLTQDEYEVRREQYGRSVAQSRLLLEALQQAEGLSSENEEYQTELAALAGVYGVDSETLIDSYGQEAVDQYIMTNLILDRVLEYAVITDAQQGS